MLKWLWGGWRGAAIARIGGSCKVRVHSIISRFPYPLSPLRRLDHIRVLGVIAGISRVNSVNKSVTLDRTDVLTVSYG
jgi:hypothetical protein